MLKPNETIERLLIRARAEAQRRGVLLSTISRHIFSGDHRKLGLLATDPDVWPRQPTLRRAFDLLTALEKEAVQPKGDHDGSADETQVQSRA